MPVLIDPQHVLTELYAISNVPTVVWIDEDDRIVRPNGVAFSTDMFKEFTGAESGPHLDASRRGCTTARRPSASRRSPRRRSPTSPTTRSGRACTSGSPSRPAGAATTTSHAATSCAPASSHRWTSPSAGPRCRSWASDPFGADFMELFAGVAGGRQPVPRAPTHEHDELTYPEGSDVAASDGFGTRPGFVGMLPLRNRATQREHGQDRQRDAQCRRCGRRRSRRRPRVGGLQGARPRRRAPSRDRRRR